MAKRRRKKRGRNIKRVIMGGCLLGCAALFFCQEYAGSEGGTQISTAGRELWAEAYLAEGQRNLRDAAEHAERFFLDLLQWVNPDNEEDIFLQDIPEYAGSPFVEVNGNLPQFDESDKTAESFETYSPLDFRGRCGVAYANIGQDLMPDDERESISEVTPSGWKNAEYDNVDGSYLYNRCHLIGFQLTGENDNEKNLITGTRYLNIDGMLPLENLVAEYVRSTGNHVLYRVTPVFEGKNLVASGVRMEAESVEDGGIGIKFHVYCYNVQPGIVIDYATGENHKA